MHGTRSEREPPPLPPLAVASTTSSPLPFTCSQLWAQKATLTHKLPPGERGWSTGLKRWDDIDWPDMRRYFPWLQEADAKAHRELEEAEADARRDGAAEKTAEEVEAACRTKQLEAAAHEPDAPGWLLLLLARHSWEAFEDNELPLVKRTHTEEQKIDQITVLLFCYGSTPDKDGRIEFHRALRAQFGAQGILRRVAEYLETKDGLECARHVLGSVPNVIAACISIAMAMTQQSHSELGRAETYRRCADKLRQLAYQFALYLDPKISRLSKVEQVQLVESTVDPFEVLHMCVWLHDINLVSVPWIAEWIHVSSGGTLTFLHNQESRCNGREIRGIPALTEMERILPLKPDEVMALVGATWPPLVFRLAAYFGCASLYPLLPFRDPSARYWFNMAIYFVYVVTFTLEVALETEDQTGGDFAEGHLTPARLYCWLAAVGTVLQELVEILFVYQPVDYLSDPWNLLQTSGSVMALVSLIMHDMSENDSALTRPCMAWATLLLWLTTLHFLEQFKETGPFISIMFTMVTSTIKFALIMMVLAGSFGVGMYVLFVDDQGRVGAADRYSGGHSVQILSWPYEFSSVFDTMRTMFRVHFGDFNYDFTGASHRRTAYVMFGLFLGLVLILMVNLLIAVLSTEHAKVEAQLEKEFVMKRASRLLTLKREVATHHLPPPLNLLQIWCGDGFRKRVAWVCWLLLAVPVIQTIKNFIYAVAGILLALQPKRLYDALKDRQEKRTRSGTQIDETDTDQIPFPFSILSFESRGLRFQLLIVVIPVLLLSMVFYTGKSFVSALVMVTKIITAPDILEAERTELERQKNELETMQPQQQTDGQAHEVASRIAILATRIADLKDDRDSRSCHRFQRHQKGPKRYRPPKPKRTDAALRKVKSISTGPDELTPQDAFESMWPADERFQTVTKLLFQVFDDVELTDSNVNPFHLNIENQTRWLCQQSQHSAKEFSQLAAKIENVEKVSKTMEAKIDRIDQNFQELRQLVAAIGAQVIDTHKAA